MTVGLKIANITSEIGSSGFFHAFFSTIAANLEPKGWGSRFPAVMTDLYQGALPPERNQQCLEEVRAIQRELRQLPVSRVVWDYEDRSKLPPWGDKISGDITDLSNYFVTSTGRDLIETILDVLDAQKVAKTPVQAVSY